MNHIEAVTLLTILQDPNADEADRMAMFMKQFPDHAELAKERWQELYAQSWEDDERNDD